MNKILRRRSLITVVAAADALTVVAASASVVPMARTSYGQAVTLPRGRGTTGGTDEPRGGGKGTAGLLRIFMAG